MANKKVSQLTSKPSVLTTDLFPIADPSTGQLYKTTISDLGTAIGSGVSSVNGLVGAVVLDTDDIQELVSPTNKWFTDTRARAALSAGTGISYNSGTGVITNAVTSGQIAAALGYTPANDASVVKLTGNQTIAGTKTFSDGTYHEYGLLIKHGTSTNASGYTGLAGTSTGLKIGVGTPYYSEFIFGTSATYAFTFPSTSGTIALTSNLSSYLPLTGGTLSGDLTLSSTNPRLYFTDTDNNPDYFISNTDGTFTIYDVTNSTARFTIGTTGNATFTNAITGGGSITGQSLYSNGIISAGSSVSATRLILTGGTSPTGLYFGHTDKVVLANYTVGGGIDFETNGGNITMQLSSAGILSTTSDIIAGDGTGSVSMAINRGAAGNSNGLRFRTAGTNNWYIGSGATGANTNLEIYNHNTATTNLLLNYSTGAATFSSSVTASGLISSATEFRLNNQSFSRLAIIDAGGAFAGGYNFNINSGTPQHDSTGALSAYYYQSGGFISFYTNSSQAAGTSASERLRITSSGNVGIGTTSPSDYSGYNTLHINGKSGANGGVLRLTAYDSTSSANIYTGGSALNINTTSAVPIKFLTRDTTRMQILDSGAIIAGNLIGNQYSMTSGSGTGTAIVDTGITYNSGDYGGYGRGVTYEVVFNGNPNGNGSAAYFAQYMGILIIYTGWSGSAVTTYIQYTQLAGGNNIGALTLTPVFWNGSTESSSIGVYTTGAQIRLKISGYNSGATGQDQSVYLRRIS